VTRASGSAPWRIALATIEYPPEPFSAGIGSYTKSLADLLTERGHHVHVVTRGAGQDQRTVEDGVTVHRLTPGRPQLPSSLGPAQVAALIARGLPDELRYRRNVTATLARLATEEGLDLIECADHMAEAGGFRAERFPAIPFVVRLHTPLAFTERVDRNIPEWARLGMRALERRLLLRATHLSAPSQVAAQAILEELAVSRPVVFYPNPPTLEPIPAVTSPRSTAAGHGPAPASGENPATVLFVGRMNRIKGPQLLVEAIPQILAEFPRTRFLFVGSDNVAAGEYRSGTQYLLSLLPAPHHERVVFTGHVPHSEVGRFYREASVVVLPSLFESFGYTCLEAMGQGKAIVGSAAGGMAELLDDGGAGLLFQPPDAGQLAAQVIRLLRDADLRRDLGTRARERAERVYGRERVMDQVEEFFARAIAERRG
jgi:glycogen(starch) synthase